MIKLPVTGRKTKVLIALTLVGGVLVLGLLLVFAQRRRDRDATQTTRPRRVSGEAATAPSTKKVKAGGNLQAAVDSARYGDTIVLEAGATYVGPLILPYKEAKGDDYITITTSNLSGISAEGERVKPVIHARAMPKIVSPNMSVAIQTAQRAHHYKFVGVEFSPAADSKYVYNLISLGESDYKSLSQFPHHLIFDRCYIHSTGLGTARRGFALNSAETSILNSHVSGFAGEGDETQAIAGWTGPGPFHIVNNHLEGGGEVIMFGGADPSIPNLVPSDIEIRRNYMHKPAEWAGRAAIKGMFELKNAKRVVIDGNVIESPIRTTALVITVRNQNGSAPWSTIEDVEITNNIIRHASTGINLLGRDTDPPTQEAKRIRIANNLFVDIDSDDSPYFMQVCRGDTITVEHNTVQQVGSIMNCSCESAPKNFVFRNNILQYNLYGVYCSGDAATQVLGRNFRGNVIADNKGALAAAYPPPIPSGNFSVPTYAQVGFVDYARGDWRLSQNSRLRGKAIGGRDPGVDFAALQRAVAPIDANAPYFGVSKK